MIVAATFFVLSCLLLAAHFFRQSVFLAVGICLLAPFLLLLKKNWVPAILQVFAYAASAVWIYTAVMLVRQRMAEARPFRGVIVILGCVTLLCVVTGLLMNSAAVKNRFTEQK